MLNNGYNIPVIGKHLDSHKSKHFFFNPVVDVRNTQPCEVVECNTILTLKNRLDEYLNTDPRLDIFMRE